MKNNKEWSEHNIVKDLEKKQDLRIVGKQIQEIKKGKGDVGIKTRGKIDFLTNFCAYTFIYVDDFPR